MVISKMLAMAVEEAKDGTMEWWWLSFADENGFRGAVLMKAVGFSTALLSTKALDINPGGEVKGFVLPTGTAVTELVMRGYSMRLLTETECVAFDIASEKSLGEMN